jgi:hypothetical protein
MEFRCRLATAGGEIIEGVYIADNEARLRRELEDKGLIVLALRRRGGLSLPGFSLGRGRRRRVRTQEFLVFNQELATLLKAGMPLVQSLDILRQRISNPTFKAVLDAVYEKVKAGTAMSDAFAEHSTLFPAVYSASLLAGERSGNLDAVIRRYVAYEKVIGAVKRRTLSALIYPIILVTMMIGLIASFRRSRISTRTSAVSCRCRPGSSLPYRTSSSATCGRCCSAWWRRSSPASPGPSSRGSVNGSTACCWNCRWLAPACGSSGRRSWRERWRRCSAAAFRW